MLNNYQYTNNSNYNNNSNPFNSSPFSLESETKNMSGNSTKDGPSSKIDKSVLNKVPNVPKKSKDSGKKNDCIIF